jgi:hypothetical protein
MKRSFLMFLAILSARLIFAGEGMWIPMLLQQLNEKEMKEMGMRITSEDIYSVNQSSLKDAIVLFGGGCTGELVSDKGLLFTNHHCGFNEIQKHSTVENDYLTKGFWAMSMAEELPNPGLTAVMLKRMEDVTDQVLKGINPGMTESQRTATIRENSRQITETAARESGLETSVRPFYQGNQYYMLYTQTFRDIRLVGAPPSNIGKFGGDTDNWVWPRHTGDFAVFRIYVNKEGKPVEYSPENVPYKPDYHIPISLNGVEENDFTFVFGYPARTRQYIPSYGVQQTTEVGNPHKIALRDIRLEVFKRYSATDPKIRLQYAAKDARVANAWKKMIGESKGIRRLNGIEKKQHQEQEFRSWAMADNNRNLMYGGIIPAFEKTYMQMEPLMLASDYINEAGLGIELLAFANRFWPLVEESRKASPDATKLNNMIDGLKKQTAAFFKDYHQPIDQEIAVTLLSLYDQNQKAPFRPSFLEDISNEYRGNYQSYVDRLFEKTIFTSESAIMAILNDFSLARLRRLTTDPAFKITADMREFYNSLVRDQLAALNIRIDSLQRFYMQGLMEMQPEKRFYPDANFTLRVTYGKVEGYSPADAVFYDYYTTLEGILEKEDPNVYDYVVEEKLKTLFSEKDFGNYAGSDGKLRVAFAASNHTTGGNSGSPILNADGHMVGINFDRCWEGTMSDLMYDPAMSRNISVDIRYVLFIIDKFAGATHLIDEMTIVKGS